MPVASRRCGWPSKGSTKATRIIALPRSVYHLAPASSRRRSRPNGRDSSCRSTCRLEGLTSLRVRFDLMGPGEVWVDDVQIFGLAFSRTEIIELAKLIALADVKLQNGQIGDCLHLLEGYWPQFLEENVALPAGTAHHTATKPRPAEEKPVERSGWLNRVKDMVPDSLRF